MNSLENFYAMMGQPIAANTAAQAPEWLPLDIPCTPPIIDKIEAELGTRDVPVAFDTDFRFCGPKLASDPARWRSAYLAAGVPLPERSEIGGWGTVGVRAESGMGAAYHMTEPFHPMSELETLDAIRALPWADLDRDLTDDHLAAEVAAIHAAGKVAMCSMECTVFEHAWYLRGMDVLFEDLITGNDIGPWLLDWVTDFSVRRARMAARAGVAVIGLGDDIGTQRGMMMAPDFWREHLKPRLARVIAEARAHQTGPLWIRYHSDGDIREVIDDLVEVGVDILNPVQPECMPVPELVAQHRHHLKFWGFIGTQTTMPFGTPDDVRAAVAECAGFAREGVGVIVAPTHVLEPDVPWGNITALMEAAKGTRL